MQLFIRTGDVCMEIPNIKLLSGWLPSVGDQEASNEESPVGPHIEPAVWFKVLVLDSVSIDCVRRAVMWNCDSALPSLKDIIKEADSFSTSSVDSDERKRISESMYIGGEFYGFESDLDELFNTMQCILREYESGAITLAYFNEQLLRLLHCYVLPVVQLTVEDLPQVEAVLFEQEENIHAIDLIILQKNTQAQEIHRSLMRQLDKHVEELSACSLDTFEEVYPLEFSQMLYEDIEKELVGSAAKLEFCQEEVERAKAAVLNGGTTDAVTEKRATRDEYYQRHKNLLMTREVIHDMIQSCSLPKRSFSETIKTSFRSPKPAISMIDPLHNIYMELHRKLMEVKGEVQKLLDKKVLMMSVKEAIRATVGELQEGSSSVGLDQHRSGLQRSTDVLKQSTIPRDWLNLAEQVAGLLGEENHAITQQHQKFCAEVIENCQAALFEKHLFEMTSGTSPRDIPQNLPEASPSDCSNGSFTVTLVEQDNTRRDSKPIILTLADEAYSTSPDKLSVHSEDRVSLSDTVEHSSMRPDSLIQLEGQLGDEDIVILHDTDKNHLKSAIEKLKRDIRKHFEDMTVKIQQELGHHSNSAYKNIWLRYESHFFDMTMSHILELYTAAYAHICERLTQSVADLTAADFDLEQSLISAMLEDFNPSLEASAYEQNVFIPAGQSQPNPEDCSFNEADNEVICDTDKLCNDMNCDNNNEPAKATHSDNVITTTPASRKAESTDSSDQCVYDVNACLDAGMEACGTARARSSSRRSCPPQLDVFVSNQTKVCKNDMSGLAPVLDSTPEVCDKNIGSDSEVVDRKEIESPLDRPQEIVNEYVNMEQTSDMSGISDDDIDLEEHNDVFASGKVDPHSSVVFLEDVCPERESVANRDSPCISSGSSHDPSTSHMTGEAAAGQTMKKIKVHYPLSVTVIYNRRTWPLPQQVPLPPDVEYGMDALSMEQEARGPPEDVRELAPCERLLAPSSGRPKLLCLRPEFRKRFELAMACIHKAITDTIPLSKMQHLTGCLREINKQVSDFQAEALHTWLGACTDDLIDMLVILLCNCEIKDAMRLYPHLMLLTDHIPPFFEGGPYSFALVQFSVAFQFIQERLVIKNRVCQPDDSQFL